MSSCHNLSYKNTLHYIEKQIGSLRLSLTTPRTKMSLFWTIRQLCKLLDGEDDDDGDGEDDGDGDGDDEEMLSYGSHPTDRTN